MKTICVVEDNTPIRKLFSILLRKAGFEVVEFSNGQSALLWLSNSECFGMITDILLPDISGDEVLNQIRQNEKHKQLKAIAITGFNDFDDKKKFIDFGFNHYMTKPIDVSTFVNEIRSIFEENNIGV